MKIWKLAAQFVEFIPDQLKEGVLYVSMEHAVASHSCACGCGRETVTPLSPTDWQLYFNGRAVTLTPSVGNWSFPCRSHYLIQEGSIRWASNMSISAIERGRTISQEAKRRQYASKADMAPVVNQKAESAQPEEPEFTPKPKSLRSWFDSMFK